jgi:hypothetical protein
MFVKLFQAFQSHVQKYPNTLEYAGKAVKWLRKQPFTPDLTAFWNRVAFTVDFGATPEFGSTKFVVTKAAGSNKLYGTSANRSNFELTVAGTLKAAQKKVSAKRSDATAKANVAKERAAEAQRLALEAQRLADAAETEANSFENAFGRVSQFATVA